MKKIIVNLLTFLAGFSLIFFPVAAGAAKLQDATDKLTVVTNGAGTTEGNLSTVVGDIISTALTLVGIIFLILMVYAGFLWMTARGAEDQIEKAKSIISAAVIGLVLIMSAYAISVLVTGSFSSNQPAPGSTTDLCCSYSDATNNTHLNEVSSIRDCSAICASSAGGNSFQGCNIVSVSLQQCH